METGLEVQGFKVVLRTRLHHKHCFQNITSDKKSKFYTCFQMSFFHRRVHFPCYKGLQSARQSLKRIFKNTTCLRESTNTKQGGIKHVLLGEEVVLRKENNFKSCSCLKCLLDCSNGKISHHSFKCERY